VADHLKALSIRINDLALLEAAASFDLHDPDERRRSTGQLERLFFQLVRVLQPDLFVEAGANDASASCRARGLLPQANIVAFEANPLVHGRHEGSDRIGRARIEYVHRALSDEVGSVSFNLMQAEDGTPQADGNGSLLRHQDQPHGFTEVEVEATPLDTYLAVKTHSRCALWVDVEGASRQVLTGARRTLDRADVVMIEVEDRAFWGQDWLRADVVSFLYDRGLLAVARDFQARYLYNIVFVRESLLEVDRVRWALTLHRSESATGSR